MTQKVVDVHNHSLPQGFFDGVAKEGSNYGFEYKEKPGGHYTLVFPDGSVKDDDGQAVPGQRNDVALRQGQLAEAGIDLALQSVSPGTICQGLDKRQAEWLVRVINDGLAGDMAQSPERISGMAAVPLQYPDVASKELERTVNELGMRSTQIGSQVDGLNLDEPQLDPFWETAERLGVLIFIHPIADPGTRLTRYHLRNLIGNPLETSIATASIIFGGVLERFPQLKICLAHSGGYAPWIRGRWRHGQELRSESRSRGATKPFDEYFSLLYFDTIIHDPLALKFLIDSVGADHVLHGTDYPADMGSRTQVPVIRGLEGVSSADKDKILGGNALRLIAA